MLKGEAEGSQGRVLSSAGAQDGGSGLAVEGTGELCGQGGGRGHAASMGKAQEDVPSLWHSGPLPKAASISAPEHALFPLTLSLETDCFPSAFEKPGDPSAPGPL